MGLRSKNLLGIQQLNHEELELILQTAESFKEVSTRDIKKVPALRGKTVVNLFFEPSTRTRTSFELAAKRLSADIINITAQASSVVKGESLLDTAMNIEAMETDIVIVRHSHPGAPFILANHLKSSVINAGDGPHEHPTQALLDIFTIKEKKGGFKGLEVAIVGDVLHSRVARSDIIGLIKMGANVRIIAPATMIPPYIEQFGPRIFYNMDEGLKGVDVIITLRLQIERGVSTYFPSIREYSRLYGLTMERIELADKNVIVMHPGPINRGIEMDTEVADGVSSVIMDQVINGMAVRMGILYLLSGSSGNSDVESIN